MRGQQQTRNLAGIVISGLVMMLAASTSIAGELSEYKRLAQQTIDQAQNGKISNIDELIAQQEK